jgi:methionyl-tRNA formyltransferase
LPLRLVFMGTPDFAVPTLLELFGAGHEVVAVYTRAPQPAGRGMELRESAVGREARKFGLPILTPKTLRTTRPLPCARTGPTPPWWSLTA